MQISYIDNFLLDRQDTVVSCDFTCLRSFGQENSSTTEGITATSVNDLSQDVSGTTDRFTLTSVIFEIETGARPVFSNPSNGLHAPASNTGDERLDLILYKPVEILSDINSLLETCHTVYDSMLGPAAIESLHAEMDNWRNVREKKFGKSSRTSPDFISAYSQVKVTYCMACARRNE